MTSYIYDSNAYTPYSMNYSQIQNYEENIPAKKEIALGPTDEDNRKCSSFLFAINSLLRMLIIFSASATILYGFNLTGNHLKCSFFNVEDILENAGACNQIESDHQSFNSFINTSRIIISLIPLIFTTYIFTNSGITATGFANSVEQRKLSGVAQSFGFAGYFGQTVVLLYFLMSALNPLYWYAEISPDDSALQLTFISYSSFAIFASIIMTLILYLTYNKCCRPCSSVAELETDEAIQTQFHIFKRQDNGSSAKMVNYSYGILYSTYLASAISNVLIILAGVSDTIGNYSIEKQFIFVMIMMLSIASLVKYPFIIYSFFRSVSGRVGTSVYALFMFSDTVILLGLHSDETYTDWAVIFQLTAMSAVFSYCGFYYLYHNQVKQSWRTAKKWVSNFFSREEWIVIATSVVACVGTSLLVQSTILEFFSSESSDVSKSLHIDFCHGIMARTDVRASLMKFQPSQSEVNAVSQLLMVSGFEMYMWSAALGLVFVLGWRFLGKLRTFEKMLQVFLLYIACLTLRDEGTKKELFTEIELGYAALDFEGSVIGATIRGRILLGVCQLWLVQLSASRFNNENRKASVIDENNETLTTQQMLTDQPAEEIEFAEENEDENSLIKKTASKAENSCEYLCERVIFRLVLIVGMASFLGMSLSGQMISARPKSFYYPNTDPEDNPFQDSFPTEVDSPGMCIAHSAPADLTTYFSALDLFARSLTVQKDNAAFSEGFRYAPLDNGLQKFSFALPNLFIIFFLFVCMAEKRFERRTLFFATMLLAFVAGMNLFVVLGYFFQVFVVANQFPYYMVDIEVFPGYYWFLGSGFFGLVALAVNIIHIYAPPASPVAEY